MEYGRECWGAKYLSAFSTELSDSNCSYACEGNSSEVCGGSLTITLFNLTQSSTSGAGLVKELGTASTVAVFVAIVGLGSVLGL